MSAPSRRRFYRAVAVVEADGGHSIALDGKPVQTPGRSPLAAPTRALADAIAAEWDAQGDTLDPSSLRLTRLANTAIDRVPTQRAAVVAEITGYAGTDLLCYRAAEPAALVARQAAGWQPMLDWFAGRFDAALEVTAGVVPVAQGTGTMNAVLAAVAALDDFTVTGLHAATTACGSVVLGLALAEARLDAEAAWSLSLLDELYQVELWGEDAEAADRRARLRQDIAAAATFMRLARAGP
ncbi:MAG: ATP12 family chaperone protein [Rhodospirillales bacterium]